MLHFGCALPDGGHVGNAWPAWRTKIRREKGMSMEITQEIVKEFLSYDPDTGVFVWLPRDRKWFNSDHAHDRWHTSHCGKVAGCLHKKKPGYHVRVIGINGKLFIEHRLAFLYMAGYIPGIIDHIDGDASNNRWDNLRASSCRENSKNSVKSIRNTSGVSGVSWDKTRGRWLAKITVNFRTVNLGRFDNIEDAERAVIRARQAEGFSERHGKLRRDEEFTTRGAKA